MANVKITDLNAYTDPASTDVLPIVDVVTDETKKVSIADLMENAGTGSEVAPSIAFDGDANTGIYRPGADQIAISTGGTKRFEISATGAVTIPGNLTAAAFIPSGSSVPTNGVYLPSSNNVAISTNSTGRLFIDSSGRLGVGTSSPSQVLDVSADDARFNLTSTGSGQTVGISIKGGGGGGDTYNYIESLDSTGAQKWYIGSNGTANTLAFKTNGNNERLRIDSSGRVGIGTTSPAESFTVGTGNAQITSGQLTVGVTGTSGLQFINNGVFGTLDSNPLILRTASDEKARIDTSGRLLVGTSTSSKAYKVVVRNDAGNAGYEGGIFLQRASTPPGGGGHGLGTIAFGAAPTGDENDSARIVAKSDGDWGVNDWPTRLEFYTTSDGSNTPTERMRIDSSGRVGIGTIPSDTLHVDGSIRITWADSRIATIFDNSFRQGLSFDTSNRQLRVFSTANGSNASIGFYTRDGAGGSDTDYGTERVRIDSSGRLLVGTSSASGNSRVDIVGNSSSATTEGVLQLRRGSDALFAENALGIINFGDTISGGNARAQIVALADATGGTGDLPARLEFRTTADGASTATERMSIRNTGEVRIESNLWNKGAIYLGPSGQDSSRFYTSSTGGSSTTMYIGNAAIQVSSDARLKENIEDTNLDALNAISKIKVKDFTWNDPSDASPNNRNARGTWTGLIAQELVEVLPFVVNAPRNEDDGSIDHDSEDRWTLDQSQLCPVLIKAMQQQQEIIASLEARLSALEGA